MDKQAQVTIKYIRISPKKIIPWLRKFRNKTVDQGYQICQRMNNKSSRIIKKVLDAGVSASQDKDLDEDNLVIKKIVCQNGPTMKRQLIRSRGRADIIKKRTSHIQLTLVEKTKNKKNKNKKDKDKNGKKS